MKLHDVAQRNGGSEAFDGSAVGDTPDRRVIDRLRVRLRAAGDKTASDQWALSSRVDLAIDASERSENQQTALQVAGIAHGRDRRVHCGAGLRKGRKRGGHNNGGGVLDGDERG